MNAENHPGPRAKSTFVGFPGEHAAVQEHTLIQHDSTQHNLEASMTYDTVSSEEVLCIEELSLNSWPALHSLHYDGWILRLANRFTDRSNSVWPLYSSNLTLDEKIDRCESFYADRDQQAVFRITSDLSRSELDDLLEKRGYEVNTPTVVQTLDITGLSPTDGLDDISITSNPDDNWINDVKDVSGISDLDSTYQEILKNIPWSLGLARAGTDGHVITLGLCVVEGGFIGLYGMFTRDSHRRQGWAKKLMTGMIHWGRSKGANIAYLHVEADNTPARTMYDSMGFVEVYRYWYRVKPIK